MINTNNSNTKDTWYILSKTLTPLISLCQFEQLLLLDSIIGYHYQSEKADKMFHWNWHQA